MVSLASRDSEGNLTSDRTIKVWDRESGNCEQTLVGHRGAVTSLQLSDDMIVSGSGMRKDLEHWNEADE